ncbi:D-alanyl-D-alanine carboxypeptidase DacB [uncultured Comamonas sp.]|nr:D-alanyl-D-alanine carboxypeptidase DacB [uncultured Comamonas sp.]
MLKKFLHSCALFLGLALAASAAWAQAQPASLPAPVQAALRRAQIPAEAVSIFVAPATPGQAPRLAWQSGTPRNPASVMKLVTTYAALDQLGPAYVWRTPLYLDGVIENGAFRGTVYLQGSGDPKLVSERLWLLLGRLYGLGVRVIVGDIVLDRSAFLLPPHDPGAFDGEPYRPYNVGPDALLINYNSQVLSFIPDPGAGVARIHYELPLADVQLPASVPLAPAGSACGDWRSQLQADWSAPRQVQLGGTYPAHCGDKNWPVALPEPERFAARAVEGMWRMLGGQLTGTVRDGKVPPGLKPAWENQSPALAEVVRDINKYSNNVMTQQLLLTLGKERMGEGSFDAARFALAQWWQQRWPHDPVPTVDNGAGLSRAAQVTAQSLGHMLQTAWASPVMAEFMASLPIAGTDGTLRRSQANASAHLKTGSLRDANALAGFVDGASGQRYVLVALINHANAGAARPALDALVDWVAQDGR